MSQLHHSSVPLQFPLPNMDIVTDATAIYWAFYLHGSGFSYGVLDPGQVLSARIILPCKNSRCNAKAYFCDHCDTKYTFLSKTASHLLNLVKMHGIKLLPEYFPTHLNVEAGYHHGEGLFKSGTFFLT